MQRTPRSHAGWAAAALRACRGTLSALVVFCVLAVSFEFSCRIEDYVQFGAPLFSPFRSLDDLIVRDASGLHGRPNAQYRQFTLNNLGMRGPDVTRAKPSRTLRVLTVGASETFGLYEPPGAEYPRQLEDSLRVLLPTLDCASPEGPLRSVQVLNAAFAGMTLPTIAANLRLQYRDLSPDVVVVYPTPSGYLDDRPPSAARASAIGPSQAPPADRVLYPRAVTRLRDQLKQSLPAVVQTLLRKRDIEREIERRGPGWRFTTIPEARLSLYESDLRTLTSEIESIGAIPVIGTHANRFAGRATRDTEMLYAWERFYPRASGDLIVRFDSLARVRTIDDAARSGVPVVDLASRLETGAPDSLFADFSHFRRPGAAIVAGALSHGIITALEQRGRCHQAALHATR